MKAVYQIFICFFFFSSVSGQVNFDNAKRIETGNQPTLLKKAYLNNDSIEDIIYLNKGDNLISYRLGIDNDTFESENHLVAVGEAKDYVIADFNKDDIPDIAITLYSKDSTALYLSLEGKIFSKRTNLSGGLGPFGISTADLNNDTNLDLVISYFKEDSLGYYKGNGDGTFSKPSKIETKDEPSHLEVLPNDDLNEFNIVLAQRDIVSLYYANPDNVFFIKDVEDQISSPKNLIIKDLDGNGYFDFVVLTLDLIIKTYYFESSNNYTEQVITTLNNPASIDLLDSNRFIVGSQNKYFSILEIIKDDYSFLSRYLSESTISAAISIGADSSARVLVANYDSNSIEIFESAKEKSKLRGIEILPYGTNSKVIATDLNNDNLEDLAYTRSNSVHILYRYDSTRFSTEFSHVTGEGAWDLVSSDVDNNGFNDLISVNSYGGTFSVLLNNGDSTFQPPINYSIDGEPRSIIANDYNNDQLDDLVISNFTGNEIKLYMNQGGGVFISEENYSISSPENLFAIDLNEDEHLDHVIYSNTEDTKIVYSASDKYLDRHETFTCFKYPIDSLDLNNDGKLDLLGFSNIGDSKLGVYQSNDESGYECLLFDVPQKLRGSVASINLNNSLYNDLIFYDTDSLITLSATSHTTFTDKRSFRIGKVRDKFNLTKINLNQDSLVDLIISNKQEIMLLTNSTSPQAILNFSADDVHTLDGQLVIKDTVGLNEQFTREILLQNNGGKAAEKLTVELLGENYSPIQEEYSIGPYSQEIINVQFISDKEGVFVGELKLSENGQVMANLNFQIKVTASTVTSINKVERSRLIYYPNPTSNVITIGNVEGKLSVKLIDSRGRVVLSSNNNTIDISSVDKGYYILRVAYGNKIFSEIIIKN